MGTCTGNRFGPNIRIPENTVSNSLSRERWPKRFRQKVERAATVAAAIGLAWLTAAAWDAEAWTIRVTGCYAASVPIRVVSMERFTVCSAVLRAKMIFKESPVESDSLARRDRL
jgi:hypothetical protein